MIADLDALERGTTLSYDICVVGGGAAGMALASEFSAGPLRVVLLEGGGQEHEPESQALYDAEIEGYPFGGAANGRFRVLGGATTRWGGQVLPLTPLDFTRRDWVPHSGWPVVFETLGDYYQRAARFLGTDELDFERDLVRLFDARVPAFDPDSLRFHFAKWCRVPDLRRVQLPRLRTTRHVDILLHANATQITLDDDRRRVVSLRARSLRGGDVRVEARRYVLCCGGLETARLLLANRTQMPNGIGNEHDLVGRYLQDHPGAVLGQVVPRSAEELQRIFNQFHHGGLKYSVRCSAAPELQRRTGILNASSNVMFVAGESSPFEALRRSYHKLRQRKIDAELMRLLRDCAASSSQLARPIYEYLVRHRSFTPGAEFRFVITTEQEPNPESRVTLTTERDALGMPKLKVQWRLTDRTAHTIAVFAECARRQFDAAGIGDIVFRDWVATPDAWRAHMVDHYHHIGTTRMHESPRHGVVDPDCRVQSVDNLYIAGSSVFPTSGHSNPTFTLVALAIRLADHLKRQMSR
jgi:choline dehydrogenase-like flavoprotein